MIYPPLYFGRPGVKLKILESLIIVLKRDLFVGSTLSPKINGAPKISFPYIENLSDDISNGLVSCFITYVAVPPLAITLSQVSFAA